MEYTVAQAGDDDRSQSGERALPGGLSRTSAWWLLISRFGLGSAGMWALIFAFGLATAVVLGWRAGLLLLVMGSLAGAMRQIRASMRKGYLVTARNQPRLHELVDAAARQILDGRVVSKIWLIPEPTIRVMYRHRPFLGGIRELRVGAPLANELPPRELRALVIRELTKFTVVQPWLVNQLIDRRAQLEQLPDWLGSRVPAWRDGFLDRTASLVRAVELAADRTAAEAGWPAETATALLRGNAVADTFDWFIQTYVLPLVLAGHYPKDLYQGWRWKLEVDGLRVRRITGVRARQFATYPTSALPTLAERVALIVNSDRPLEPLPHTHGAPMVVLSSTDQAALARDLVRPALPHSAHGVEFAAADNAVLDGPTLAVAQAVRAIAPTTEGKNTTLSALRTISEDLGGVLAIVRRHAARDVAVAAFAEGFLDDDSGAVAADDLSRLLMRAVLLADLVDRGFTPEHPLRRHVLRRASDGVRVDLPALVGRDPRATGEIVELLEKL